jgi:hypothetical protein
MQSQTTWRGKLTGNVNLRGYVFQLKPEGFSIPNIKLEGVM